MRNDPTFLDKFANPKMLFIYLITFLVINILSLIAVIIIRKFPIFLSMHSQSKIKSFFSNLAYHFQKHLYLKQIFFILIYIALFALYFFIPPKVIYPSAPAFGKKNIDSKHPLHLTFDRPIDFSKINISIKPNVKGIWQAKTKDAPPGLKNDLYFYPEATLPSDAEFSATITHVTSPVINVKGRDYLFNFRTPAPPSIMSLNVKENEENIDINNHFSIRLNYDDRYRTQWQATLNPDVKLATLISKDGKTITFIPQSPLQKSMDYTLTINQIPVTYSFKLKKVLTTGVGLALNQIKFKTVLSPSVKSSSPTGSGVLTNSPIKIEFRQPMDQASVESAFSISPTISGKNSWQANSIIFSPDTNLAKNTHYTISIKKSAMTQYKTTFDANYSFGFTTIGYVVPSFSPANGAGGIALNKALTMTFNQAVDHDSAQNAFSLSPNITGSFSWKGNALTFSPSQNYGYTTTYSISIDSGVKSINGLDSNQAYSSRFTTQDQVVKLNIPFHKQEHYYTCGIAAARMALDYKGAKMSEMAILNEVGYDSTPLSADGKTWGNPNVGFVGTLMGQPKGTGYGAHWGPIAKAINNHRPAEVKTGWNVQGIASEIAAGNPVVIFWVNGVWPSYERHWKTPDGTDVRAVNGMHAVVVNGFTGSPSNPKSFTVSDPWWPRKSYDIALFNSYWRWFNNTAIVVR